MIVKTKTVTHLQFEDEGKPKVTVKINDDLSFSYGNLGAIRGYAVTLQVDRGRVYVAVGCRDIHNPIETFTRALKNLQGEDMFEEVVGLKNTKTNKLVRTVVDDESEKYFITKSKMAYSKSDHIKQTYRKTTNILTVNKSGYEGHWKYNGYNLNENTKKYIDQFVTIIEILTTIEEFQQNQLNKND